MEHVDACVVGAGVVGLAVARALALRSGGRWRILLLEKNSRFGAETSSRHSEVIHAGLYYPPDSLKARLCLEGRERLYRFCQTFDVPCQRIGKLIVAGPDEYPALERIRRNALLCGLAPEDLGMLEADRIRALEPAVAARYALLSPTTGIIDSHILMQRLLQQGQENGVDYVPRTRVEKVWVEDDGFVVQTRSGDGGSGDPFRFSCRALINCAGLHAADLARRIDALPPDCIPRMAWYKGQYFRYTGRSPFRRLIYPLPDPGQRGLGIHATLDTGGGLRFGPDSQRTGTLDYTVDESHRERFGETIRRYFPALETSRLHGDYAGIRPRLAEPEDGFPDFVIQTPRRHGIPGLVQLFAIDSPGLTASLPLADRVVNGISAGIAVPAR